MQTIWSTHGIAYLAPIHENVHDAMEMLDLDGKMVVVNTELK